MGLNPVRTLVDLVAINSVNPAYAQGRPEAEIQAYVLDFFRRHDISACEQPVMPGRANVIGMLPGRAPGRRIVFEAHSDTAGIEGMTVAPLAAEVRDGRLYGRGACDTKAGLAAMLHAIADLRHSGTVPEAEVWVVAAVDEEHSYRGVVRLLDGPDLRERVLVHRRGEYLLCVRGVGRRARHHVGDDEPAQLVLVRERVFDREDAAPRVAVENEVAPVQTERLPDLFDLVHETIEFPQ